MCGRYAATSSPEKLAEEVEAEDATGGGLREDYNVAPTKDVPVVRERTDDDGTRIRRIELMRWGLVPSWAKDTTIGNRMINARIESVADKAAFRLAAKRRRCLVPADGWYEWAPPSPDQRGKQPYFMTRSDGHPLAFAGLYELWRPKEAESDAPWLVTVTVITEPAIGVLAEIHDRMPYVLAPDQWDRWLDTQTTDVTGLLVATPEDYVAQLEVRPVSTAVNNVRNNGPELVSVVPLGPPAGDEQTSAPLPGV